MLSENLCDPAKSLLDPDVFQRDNNNSINDQKIKIAIIGAGISGCSTAFFLKQLFEERVDLTVFEKTNEIGGRLRTLKFNDRPYELGGSILHPSNLYMENFLGICDLEKKDESSSSLEYLALYDKNGIIIQKTGNFFGIADKIRFIKHFGFMQLYKLDKFISKFVNQFSKIYKLQDKGFTFTTLEQFLNKLSPRLFKASQTSLREFLEEEKFSEKIINEMASIACLANYGQTVDIDGFVGLVSLAGVSGKLWSIKNGNYLVPVQLLKKSGAKLLTNTNVKLICQDKENKDTKNMIIYEDSNGIEITAIYDYVIVGFPIYSGIIGHNFQIDLEANAKNDQFNELEMQLTNTYFIYGTVKLFQNLPYNKRIQLHSVDPSIPYRTICVQLPCDYSKIEDAELYLKSGEKLYKIFSEENLDNDTFDKIFEKDYRIICEMPWLAYPKYKQNPKLKVIPDVILDSDERSRVFYLNSLEWSSSCMEISAISARNVSLLIANKENVVIDKKKNNYSSLKPKLFNETLHKICGIFSLLSIAAFLFSIYFNNN